ncbi:MAG: hypothetical protein R3190_04315 [Thermoanaerobaculia bacterium]|nr:hypothetical protein [Thermoanaerobaculia bacterium]
MTRRRGPGRLVGIAAAPLLLATVGALLAQATDLYREGLDAVAVEDWVTAESRMRAAIAERPEARQRRRLVYIPHYYLGLARFRQGDCAGADEAWRESERQGVVQGLNQARSIARGRETCRLDAERSQAVAVAQGELRETSVAAAALLDRARREGTREVWDRGDPSPASRHRAALDKLAEARELLTAEATVADVGRARELVREADRIFADLDGAVTDLTGDWQEMMGDQRQDVRGLAEQARSLLADTRYLAPYPRAVRKARADLEGLLGEADRMRPDPSADYLEGLKARLASSIENLRAATAGPPSALRQAAAAFLDGDYVEALAALDGAQLTGARARSHAHLLLAASRYLLYLEGGEADPGLLDGAVADVVACREASPSFRPDPRIFSPRFVTFFEETHATAAAAR